MDKLFSGLQNRRQLRPNRPAPSNNINQQQQQQQQRRKWSDWTECSASCVKTRHRLNCDDILATTNSTTASTKISSNTGKSDNDDNLLLSKPSSQESSPEVNNNDEDDYADEEDQDEDPCANVDTRKTFEEVPCSGGACSPLVSPSPSHHHHHHHQRQKINQANSKQAATIALHHDRKNRTSLVQSEQPPVVGQQEREFQLDWHGPTATVSPASKPANEIHQRLQQTEELNGYVNLTSQATKVATKTGTIWPPQLFWPSQSSYPAKEVATTTEFQRTSTGNLIQWAILIGFALTLVLLLIMLILRKLFSKPSSSLAGRKEKLPSYQWLLAKQTSSEASPRRPRGRRLIPVAGEQQAADCCRSSASILAGYYVSGGPDVQPHHQHHPPHHASYLAAWDGRNHLVRSFERLSKPSEASGSSSSNIKNKQPTQQQIVTFSSPNGHHVLNSSLTKAGQFNTDYADLPPYENPASILDHHHKHFLTGHKLATDHEKQSQQQRIVGPPNEEHLLSDSYDNYDTVSSFRKTEHNIQQEDRGFVFTRDFVPMSTRDQPDTGCSPVTTATTSTSGSSRCHGRRHRRRQKSESSFRTQINSGEPARHDPKAPPMVARDDQQQQQQLQQLEPDNSKHGSPIVPRTMTQDERRLDGIDGTSNSSRSSSSSSKILSSRKSDGGSSSSSSSESIQSTTAPMLSNAASFEQAPSEFGDDLPPMKAQPPITSQSSTNSPLANASCQSRNTCKATIGMVPQMVQSQPNSPMFANQFATGGAIRQHRRMPSSNFRPGLNASARQLTNRGQDANQEETPPAPSDKSSRSRRCKRRQDHHHHHHTAGNGLTEARGYVDGPRDHDDGRRQLEDCDNNYNDDERHFYEEISPTTASRMVTGCQQGQGE